MVFTSPPPIPGHSLRRSLCIFLFAVSAWRAAAQLPDISAPSHPESQTPTAAAPTMLPHLGEGRFWLSGQMNFIGQVNPAFAVRYSGPNSFRASSNNANGRVITLYAGVQIDRSTEVLIDGEEAEGLGLSSAVGIAGFTDLDAVRDPSLPGTPYLARLMLDRVVPFGRSKDEADRGPLSTFSELPRRRLEFRVGKFGMTDFFDTNAVGSDSHLQFMNWSIDQNGAYDFTADSRGYTWGILAEYQSPAWGARFAEALMPGPKNGGPLVWNLHRANTSNAEFEVHRGPANKNGIVRVLGWVNHANMGDYKIAINQYLAGITKAPDISAHPLQVTAKYGFGVNLEQALSPTITAYGRFGWNNGETESWSFTEIDQTVSSGVGFLGSLWKRANDHAGVAVASNGISSVHARYLAIGGLGFVLGDGRLNYGRENVVESYYTAHLWRGMYAGPDLQSIVDPGFNKARGPVVVFSLRLHVEL